MSQAIVRIEINFPQPVEMTDDEMRLADNLAGEICRRYERNHPGRVMWPAGVGQKVTYMPMTRAEEEAGRHTEFDPSIFDIEVAERADWDWPCAKCGKEQGDHKDNIIDPPAGDCDFEAAVKERGPEPVTGLVPMRVYLSAVKGRADMRHALREARAKVKDEAGWLIEAAESEPSRPLYWAGSFGDERDHWTHDHLKAVRHCRKEDAEAVAAGVLHGYAVRIADHLWVAPRSDATA